jgi:hypothetical protein
LSQKSAKKMLKNRKMLLFVTTMRKKCAKSANQMLKYVTFCRLSGALSLPAEEKFGKIGSKAL